MRHRIVVIFVFFFFQAEDGIRDAYVTGVQTCALPICTTDFDWLRSLGEHSSCTTNQEVSVDRQLQVAYLLLRRGCILESGGSRIVRLPHQPTDLSLLRSGSQPDSSTRSHRSVRGLRNAWSGTDSVLPARAQAGA